MSKKRYAIWYEPTEAVYDELKKIILDLSKKYNSPIFEPHITLLPGGCELDKKVVIEKLNNIVKRTKPFKTTFVKLNQLDEYFKSIFIEVEKTKDLINFANNIQKEVNGAIAQNYIPHLSILYGKFSNDEKEETIKLLGRNYTKSFTLNKVDIIEYEFNQPPETWKKVASIEL